MARRRTWTFEINITEHEDGRRTHAGAILSGARPIPRGGGEAHRWPDSQEAPEIDDESATARALADLAWRVLDVAGGDIEQQPHRPMRLLC